MNGGTKSTGSPRIGIAGKPATTFFVLLFAIGAVAFVSGVTGLHPGRAWQAYLINVLVFSSMAAGGLLFSALMHVVRARWTGVLSALSEGFAAFFPVSIVLFALLPIGREHVFPWLHHDLGGKRDWLNLPFLFYRDLIGLLVLYGFGTAYLFHALWMKRGPTVAGGRFRRMIATRWDRWIENETQCRRRMDVFAVFYMIAFAVTLSLLGFDLVMAADPGWVSALFGAFTFTQAIYLGLGGLIILAAICHRNPRVGVRVRPEQFHDMGKLFFAFCLIWADFFYCQFAVIWYGNIPEETAYVIRRTVTPPWHDLAWAVFAITFVIPFVILLNRRIKTVPWAMIGIAFMTIVGLWLENYLLTGPAFFPAGTTLGLNVSDLLISLGFVGLMAGALIAFFRLFPELTAPVSVPAIGEEVS